MAKPQQNCSVHRGTITSRDSSHLLHNSHYDILTTALKEGVEMLYEECSDQSGQTVQVLFFFIFLLTVQRSQIFLA